MTLTTPLSGVVCHQQTSVAIVNLHMKLKFLSPPVTKIRKAMQNVDKGVVGVVMGHSRSLKIAPFNTAHASSY